MSLTVALTACTTRHADAPPAVDAQADVRDAGEIESGTTDAAREAGVAHEAEAGQQEPSDPGCPQGLPGPSLREVPARGDGGVVAWYCIDATEVTNADYAAFLAAGYPTSGQPDVCADNETYAPSDGWPAIGKEDYPVVNVSWCDAVAYCAWAGKHLCGKIGGGTNDWDAHSDAAQSEWYNACSAGGVHPEGYPYPWYDSPHPYTTCNTPADVNDYPANIEGVRQVLPVRSKPACQGADEFAGVFDLIGNVAEWENSCEFELEFGHVCWVRGGSASTSGGCSNPPRYMSASASDVFGFRCCADSLTPPVNPVGDAAPSGADASAGDGAPSLTDAGDAAWD